MSQIGSAGLAWRKSTRCESQHCVEVAQVAAGMAVRDSTDPGWVIIFDGPSWRAFLGTLRAG